uniref:EF-hand domain-containing protein n=1 Tax=Rhizophora mucronata TaxID=61149 RepID=A0A2P2QM29_RHIMU
MMATDDHRILSAKRSNWLHKKVLKLSLHRRGRRGSKPRSTISCPNSPASPCTPITSTTKEEGLREVFRYFDGDGDGKISAVELRAYFGSIGEYMSHEEAQTVIDDLDTDGDKLLDFQDFLRLMNRGAREENDDDLKMAFEMFELEKGSGCITPKGLQKMLHRLGDEKSYDECVAMIHVFDTDGNGVLDFHEFHRMMCT